MISQSSVFLYITLLRCFRQEIPGVEAWQSGLMHPAENWADSPYGSRRFESCRLRLALFLLGDILEIP